MSFILESLKQAQRERKSDKGLDLNSVYTDEDGPRRRSRLWFWISILLAIIVIGLIVTLWVGGPARVNDALVKSDPASLAPESGQPEKVSEKPAPTPAKKREKAKRKPARPLSREASVSKPVSKSRKTAKSGKTGKTAKSTKTGKIGKTGKTGKSGKAGTGGKSNLPPDYTYVDEDSGFRNDDSDFEYINTINDQSEPPSWEQEPEQDSEQASEQQPSPVDKQAIVLFEDLPREIRDRLGHLEINIHAWSKNPSKSLVVVNMRRYRVGERIGVDGPLVESITPDGVIIDHGNGRALLLAE